jgi:hypothetical protein
MALGSANLPRRWGGEKELSKLTFNNGGPWLSGKAQSAQTTGEPVRFRLAVARFFLSSGSRKFLSQVGRWAPTPSEKIVIFLFHFLLIPGIDLDLYGHFLFWPAHGFLRLIFLSTETVITTFSPVAFWNLEQPSDRTSRSPSAISRGFGLTYLRHWA